MHAVLCTLYSITEYRDPLSPLLRTVYTICGMLVLYYMKTTVLCRSMSNSFMVLLFPGYWEKALYRLTYVFIQNALKTLIKYKGKLSSANIYKIRAIR